MTIVITGGSGYIGTKLTRTLLGEGHTVIIVDQVSPRFTHERLFFIQCNLSHQTLPYNVLERTDAVINLAGAPINKTWTSEYKEIIRSSRINSTRTIVHAIEHAQSRPTVLISASAVGYYGDTADKETTEQGQKGDGFLADVVEAWEQEAERAEDFGVRVVLVRTAPVLGKNGFLKELTKSAPFGFLVRLTKKNYWMSWIHEDDIVNAYLFALGTSTVVGPINASAPESMGHRNFVALLAHTMHRKVLGSIPEWIAKKVFGELFDEITKNQRIVPQRLYDKGFIFLYPTAKEAFENIYPHTDKKTSK